MISSYADSDGDLFREAKGVFQDDFELRRFRWRSLSRSVGLRGAPGGRADSARPGFLPDVHPQRALEAQSSGMDALVRRIPARHHVDSVRPRRRILARTRRTVYQAPGAAAIRPRRTRPWLPVPLHVRPMARVDRRSGAPGGADSGGPDPGLALPRKGRVPAVVRLRGFAVDRKSTRLNSSHANI